jgi:hypothetical protein
MARDVHYGSGCFQNISQESEPWNVELKDSPTIVRKEALMLAPTLKQQMDDFVLAVATNQDLFRGEQFIQEVWWEIFAEDLLRQVTAQIRHRSVN